MPSVAVLIPILTLPFWLFYFDITPKIAALLAGAAIACLLAPANVTSIRNLWKTRKLVVVTIALLAAALIVSTAFSTHRALSFGGSNWRGFGMVTQLALLVFTLLTAASIASGTLGVERILRAVALSGSAIALYAILQYLGWDPLLSPATYHIGEGEWTIVRPPGTVGHADYLGSYLVFVLFLGGSLWTRESHRTWRTVGIACAILSAFAIFLSGTRSAILAAICGAALLLYRFRPGWRQTAAGLAIALIALAGFYFSPLGLKLRGRTRWYIEDPAGGARLLLWRDSLHLALGRWPAGWGAETFGASFPHYESLELARAFPDFYHESPHNIFIDELTDQGLIGIAALLAWTGIAGRAAFRQLRTTKTAPIGAALLGGLTSLQFNSFVVTTAFFFFLTCVLVLVAPEDVDIQPRKRMPVALAALAGVPLALLFSVFAVRMCVADATMSTVRKQMEAGNVLAASARYETVRRWEPRPGAFDAYYSKNMASIVRRQRAVYNAVKGWQEAIQSGIRATQLAEDPQNAAYSLASLYGQADNRKESEHYLRSAIADAPNWFKPHWVLARLLESSGRHEQALVEASAAVERDGGKHAEVAETLRQLQAK